MGIEEVNGFTEVIFTSGNIKTSAKGVFLYFLR